MRGSEKKQSALTGIFLLLAVCCCWYSCSNSTHSTQNKLANAASPYLREHADNPVHWYPWGAEALQKARDEDKPLLISIGYASCHWCHVMERESFMDTMVARIMNEEFISIKVDREERPDIDNIYMHACQLMNNGEAGWPLNAFALPDGKPFFAGTYYTKDNWVKLLKQIAASYKNQKGKVQLQAESLTFGMIDNDSALLQIKSNSNPYDGKTYRTVFENIYHRYDTTHGGLQGAPKFPNPSLWEFNLQYHYYTQDPRALKITLTTLHHMANGAVYDHVGGGFARYATDSVWQVPHFEKMLCDNAQLISLYAHAYQVTGEQDFKRVAEETIEYIEAELTAPGGGYFSSQNAESGSGEGDYYAWTLKEIRSALGSNDSELFTKFFNASEKGNWKDGKNLLFASLTRAEFAARQNVSREHLHKSLGDAQTKLAAIRKKRAAPSVDTKILTSWNALLVKAYADAYAAFGNEVLLKKAETLAAYLEQNMIRPDGRLWRLQSKGTFSVDGFLDDYAFLAKSFIRLYEVSFNKKWLLLADRLIADALVNFYDKDKAIFYYTSATSEKLAVRKAELFSNVIPSPNAVMAENLLFLGSALDKELYLTISRSLLEARAAQLETIVPYSGQWGYLAGLLSYGSSEVVLMGKDALQKSRDLQKHYLPSCMFMGGTEENLPLLQHKLPAAGTLIYVCTNKTCKLPVEETNLALQQIRKLTVEKVAR